MSSSLPLTPASTVVSTPDAISSTLAGEEVILDLVDGTYYGLDDVGTRIWHLLDTPRCVADLCDTLEAEYDVDRPALERDVMALLTDMARRNLVQPVS
jgi:hypothetical protein